MAPNSSFSSFAVDFCSLLSIAFGKLKSINGLNFKVGSTLTESFFTVLGSEPLPLIAWACKERTTEAKSMTMVFNQFMIGWFDGECKSKMLRLQHFNSI